MKTTFFFVFICHILFTTLAYTPHSVAEDSRQWHLPEGATARLGKGWLSEIEYSPDGSQLAVAGTIGIWIYDTATDQEIAFIAAHESGLWSMAYSPDGNMIAGGSAYGSVYLWNATTGELLHTFTGHRRSVRSLVFSPDGSILASGSRDATIRLWNPKRVNF